MIYTSYFANIRNLPEGFFPISICGKAPEGYKGAQYKKVAPKWSFFSEWKKNHDNDYYIKCFKEQVLSDLDAGEVVHELTKLLPEDLQMLNYITNCPIWGNPHVNIVLVCYEKPEDFCHRHLVAEWFNQNGIRCAEWVKPDTKTD